MAQMSYKLSIRFCFSSDAMFEKPWTTHVDWIQRINGEEYCRLNARHIEIYLLKEKKLRKLF